MHDNFDPVKQQFLDFLHSDGVSEATIKFYASDLNHFEGWLIEKLASQGSLAETISEAFPFLNLEIAQEYKYSLESASNPKSTANRRLSSIRRFGSFIYTSGFLSYDFAQSLTNLPISESKQTRMASADFRHAVDDFERHLLSRKKSPNTVRNYVADVKQFLEWLEAKYEPANT